MRLRGSVSQVAKGYFSLIGSGKKSTRCNIAQFHACHHLACAQCAPFQVKSIGDCEIHHKLCTTMLKFQVDCTLSRHRISILGLAPKHITRYIVCLCSLVGGYAEHIIHNTIAGVWLVGINPCFVACIGIDIACSVTCLQFAVGLHLKKFVLCQISGGAVFFLRYIHSHLISGCKRFLKTFGSSRFIFNRGSKHNGCVGGCVEFLHVITARGGNENPQCEQICYVSFHHRFSFEGSLFIAG